MLSDEEKKAIKELTEIKELFEEDLKENYEVTATLDQIDLESLVIALNLIEKQQTEIEELKEDSCCMTTCLRRDKEKLFLEDKIKAKIEELEKMNIHEFETMNVLEVLQSLLEKE